MDGWVGHIMRVCVSRVGHLLLHVKGGRERHQMLCVKGGKEGY